MNSDHEHTRISRGSQTMQELRLSLSSYLDSRSFKSFSNKKCTFDSDSEVSGPAYKSSADQVNDRPRSLRGPATSQLSRSSSAQLSLADITTPSFLNLPLFASEISNSQWYDFGPGGLVLGWRKWGIISSCLPRLSYKNKGNTATVSNFENVNRC